ncbi:YcxB family protein [Cohnella sp. AR92]|uniref:YcxB family protein n=1 Tax=Cohnella sp. AR92 TaxID=648716 RepID=UPI00351A1DCE
MLWQDFTKYIVTKKNAYLFITNQSAHLIPLSGLAYEDLVFLLGILKGNVTKQKKGCLFTLAICLLAFLLLVGLVQFFVS